MNYIKPISKSAIVNKFADVIMLELNKDNDCLTSITVSMFPEFFVIHGETVSKEVLDFDNLKEKFYEDNKNLLNTFGIKKINIIDLVRYNIKSYLSFYNFDYYQSERPIFHEKVIDKVYNSFFDYEKMNYTDRIQVSILSLVDVPREIKFERIQTPISSEFPYGYSLSNGRLMYYYGEYLTNQLFSSIKTQKINFLFNLSIVEDDSDVDFEVYSNSPYLYESVKSMVLDVFDFNLTKFKNDYLKGYDLSNEIENQLNPKPWLVRDKLSELYII